MRTSYHYQGFQAGQVSPLAMGLMQRQGKTQGLTRCENMMILKQGILTRRPGTRLLALCSSQKSYTALGIFKSAQAGEYLLVIDQEGCSVYRQDKISLQAHKLIISIQATDPVLLHIPSHGLIDTDWIWIDEHAVLSGSYRVKIISKDICMLLDMQHSERVTIPSQWRNSTGRVAKMNRLTLPYAKEHLFDDSGHLQVELTQIGQVMYWLHPAYPPYQLRLTASGQWQFEAMTMTDGPYLPVNETATTLTPSASQGMVTITASTALFAPSDKGRHVRLMHQGRWGYARIVEFKTAFEVRADVKATFGDITVAEQWCLGAWSHTTGFPSRLSYLNNRFVYGSVMHGHVRIDVSMAERVSQFSPSDLSGVVAADHAFWIGLQAEQAGTLAWIRGHNQRIVVATTHRLWQINSIDAHRLLAYDTISVTCLMDQGAASSEPCWIGNRLLFIHASKYKLMESQWQVLEQRDQLEELTAHAPHIGLPGIKMLVWQAQPYGIVWGVRADGVLIGLTYDPASSVMAWHEHHLGGEALNNQAKIESICGGHDDQTGAERLWLVVKRQLNGRTIRSIEYLPLPYDLGTEKSAETLSFVDCTHHDSHPLAHDAGQALQVTQNGDAGFTSRWVVQTFPLCSTAAEDPSLQMVQRIDHVSVQLVATGVIDAFEAKQPQPWYRPEGQNWFTGYTGLLQWPGEYQPNASVGLTHYGDQPATMLAIISQSYQTYSE